MAEIRQPRDSDTRDATAHAKAWTPPETLPTPAPKEGYVFRWIRTALMGQIDATNAPSKFREGWEPVKASEHPELMLLANPNGRFKENLEIGGLLLCKAPKEMMAQRASFYARQASSQMDAVDNSFMKNDDPRMPMGALGKPIERKSEVTFGRGNK